MSDGRLALSQRRREAGLSPLERDQVETVLLSAAGGTAPRIAALLSRGALTVHTTVRCSPVNC